MSSVPDGVGSRQTQALLVLTHLRCGHTYAQLAAGFGVGTSTVHRYVAEAVEILAALAPGLATAVGAAARKAFVVLDGTLLPIDRIAADRPHPRHHRRPGPGGHHLLGRQGVSGSRRYGAGSLPWPLGEAVRRSAGRQQLSHAKILALGEQAMAALKTWRLLRKLRCSTTRITALVQAVLTLHLNASR
ncbi:IS5 family transposase [Streptomyces fuscichromogenes]|uniref:IS5 family transposase n=1 Tax=Streptomyces fuscichromogenes TaxID=1324013 RepID=A0A917XJE5_9ACTN|nr:IS5 family transposase [Streptomyces fuscichromogenes]